MLILIVDSSILIIERLEDLIEEAGIVTTIHKATGYEQAKLLFIEKTHEAVLMDIDLPKYESLKLLKEIKETNKNTCVIVLYTQKSNYIHELCKSLGVEFYFDKYYDFEKIAVVLKNKACERADKNIIT